VAAAARALLASTAAARLSCDNAPLEQQGHEHDTA
jgi:hypothetical protein